MAPAAPATPLRVAVVGGGVAGLAAAWRVAAAGHSVTLYERDVEVGGHARTVQVDGVEVDVGFMVFNRVTYPNMLEWFDSLGVAVEPSDMSFAVSLKRGSRDEQPNNTPFLEWGSDGLDALFAQRANMLNPSFLRMISEMLRFRGDAERYLNDTPEDDIALGGFLNKHGYSAYFKEYYLLPVCAAIWSCSTATVLACSANSILSFLKNHHMLQVLVFLRDHGADIRLSTPVKSVTRTPTGVSVVSVDDTNNSHTHTYDKCILACHAPDALAILGDDADQEERDTLSAFGYSESKIYLHRDVSFMPTRRNCWSSWNFLGDAESGVTVTYWLNRLQASMSLCRDNLPSTVPPLFVTLNPSSPPPPSSVASEWRTSHPVPSRAAALAAARLTRMQGTNHTYFAGAYAGYGFHEDGFVAGVRAASALLQEKPALLPYPKQFALSVTESVSKAAVIAFLRGFIKIGSITIAETGGSTVVIGNPEGDGEGKGRCQPHCQLRCAGPDATVMDLLELLIVNRDAQRKPGGSHNKRVGWLMAGASLATAGLGYASAYFRHLLRANTLSQARRNIAAHYDLGNELFSLFLDPTMAYSCAVFQHPGEPLQDAQTRKIMGLIEKARIGEKHRVLDIGFGWGSLAIMAVQATGCHVTGITLSKEQLALAQSRVDALNLSNKITFKLCDYRSLADVEGCAFDRIVSCEMLEAVGHEYLGDFYGQCDRLLKPDGIMVVQVITTPEERYDVYRKSSDFIKEYIFPGCCVPSFASLISAMSSHSSFSIESAENIGPHYAPTLLKWREAFLSNIDRVRALGFDEKFIRAWDYYFLYCAVGFRTRTLGVMQIVYSRPGNTGALGQEIYGTYADCKL
eukprot:jgi/Chlat1/2484/Chrsp175S02424